MGVQIAYWALVGWCGTKWPGWWKFPPPPPPPDPWWRVIGALGGIGGGYLFSSLWGVTADSSIADMAATGIGAWIGSVVVNDIYGLVMPRKG